MFYRVMGRAGSGKTEFLLLKLKQAFLSGEKCLIIVPEQESLSTEKKLSEQLGDAYNMSIEVLNFERLPNRVAREYGNLAVNYIDRGGRDIIMSVVLDKLSDKLNEYKNVSGSGDFVKSIITVIKRLKLSGITVDTLEKALDSESVKSNQSLYKKLKDIRMIYEHYQAYLSDSKDPFDALTTLGEELERNTFFTDYTVFIDGYYTFTEQEYSIIEKIIKQSKDTYISFFYDGNDSLLFKESRASANRIKRLAGGVCEDVYTGGCKRHSSLLLTHIEENLWESEAKPLVLPQEPKENGDTIRIIEAANSFEEAEAIAAEIIRLTRDKGLRYRDISVVFGKLDDYEGVIDVVFDRNNIPYFMSVKDELGTKPLFSFIFACLEVIIAEFSVSAVKKYIKTGFTSLTVDESDILLRYAEMWDIKGKLWYNGDEWQMNPEGYREELSDYGEHILLTVNRAKAKISPFLSNLRQSLLQKELTVASAVRALYSHLIDIEADKKLLKKAQYLRDIGEEEEAQKERQLWDMLINIFDQLYKVCGDEKINLPRLYELIKIMSEEYTVGSIPTSVDQIKIGTAALFRPESCRALIIGGVNDGVLPAYAGRDEFFDDDELVLLEQAGCNIGEKKFERQNRERFIFYTLAAAPVDYLILTYPTGDLLGTDKKPSLAIGRIKKLIPAIKTERFGSQTDFLYSAESAKFYANSQKNKILKAYINRLLSGDDIPTENVAPLFDSRAVIRFNKDILPLSPSRIERYNYCNFSFFASYLLKLRKKDKIRFATPEIGSFIHKILEQFLIERTKNGIFFADEKDITESTENLSKKYFLEVVGGLEGKNRRFLHLYTNLKRTLNLLLRDLSAEFAQSRFIPTGFEQKIGYETPDSLPAVVIGLEDGKKAIVRGSIDRVDTYEYNGITYVRVVDYKTYNKGFSLKYFDKGIDLQMLNYLFAYCKAEKNRQPAGILYYPAILPTVEIDNREVLTDDKIQEKIFGKLKRSGIILRDIDIIKAMEKECGGNYIPVKLNKDGTFDKRNEHNLLDTEQFDLLKEQLYEQIEVLARSVFDGEMSINPKKFDESYDACRYCDYKSICRYTKR